jgi:hypothetical protein
MSSPGNLKFKVIIALAIIVIAGYVSYTSLPSPKPAPPITTPIESSSEGTLKGRIYCIQKVGDSPCSSSLEITASTGTVRVIQSNNDGSYSITLPAGKYTVKPQPKPGYPVIVPVSNPITVPPDQITTLDIRYSDGTK